MKRAIVMLTLVFALSNVYANDEKMSKEDKLVKEIKAEMEKSVFYVDDLKAEPDVLVYNIDGKLLHSFQKENIDPVAMRNADLIMEIKSQKIFIKVKELKPTI